MCVQRSRYIEIKRRKKNSGVGALSFHNTFFSFYFYKLNLSVCALLTYRLGRRWRRWFLDHLWENKGQHLAYVRHINLISTQCISVLAMCLLEFRHEPCKGCVVGINSLLNQSPTSWTQCKFRTTVQQRGQNHHMKSRASSRNNTSRVSRRMVPSNCTVDTHTHILLYCCAHKLSHWKRQLHMHLVSRRFQQQMCVKQRPALLW